MIEVSGLTRYYGSFPALEDVSFSIDNRVIVGFLGLNGAGKSTVLKILGGVLMPSAGSVRIAGVDASEAPDSLRKRIGYLPEEPPLYREMRVRDFLVWCARLKGYDKSKLPKRLEEVIGLCNLEDVADDVIETLSHGYRKRVGIAQAIIHEPELVILDEPISGLDPVQIVEMRQVLKNLKGTCTILVSSHILSEISQTCDRILVLHEGRIVGEGSEEELSERFQGAHRLSLTVRGDESSVRKALEGVEALESIRIRSTHGDGLLDFELDSSADAVEAIAAALVEASIGIRRIEHAEAELESAFIGLTSSRAGAPSAAPVKRDGAAPKPAAADAPADTAKEEPPPAEGEQ